MTTSRKSPESPTERERKSWRLPVDLVQFLRAEARYYDVAVAHLVIRIFGALETYYEQLPASVQLLDKDRQALGLGRWPYLVHILEQRALALKEQGEGFDAPEAISQARFRARGRMSLERYDTGAKVLQSWYLPPHLLEVLRREADEMGWEQTPMAMALLNLYGGYFPLPEAAAAQLEADRWRLELARFEYLRHAFWRRFEAVKEKGPGFDRQRPKKT